MPIRRTSGRFGARKELVDEVARLADFAEEALDDGDLAALLEYVSAGRLLARLAGQRCPALRCEACGRPLITLGEHRADECECDACTDCGYPACVCDLTGADGGVRLGAANRAVAGLRLTETPGHS